MSTEIVPRNAGTAITFRDESLLPSLVERAGGAARFAWDEYFFAEHHNPHTQKAYMRAMKRFMAWAEGCQTPTVWGLPDTHRLARGNSNRRQSLGVWVSGTAWGSRVSELVRIAGGSRVSELARVSELVGPVLGPPNSRWL
jgi:hypothetical protein